MNTLQVHIEWFREVLRTALAFYFEQECEYSLLEEIEAPEKGWLEERIGVEEISFEERVVIILALMPQLSPQVLDILFIQNKDYEHPYSEFGGWKGMSHNGFLPTGETAAFILAGEDMELRRRVIKLFDREHWFYTHNILRLEGAGEGEPFLSGQLRPTDELLSRVIHEREYKPDYNTRFPAKRVTTELNWEDMVLGYQTASALEEINSWLIHQKTIMEDWGLSRFLKAGYRALFYGPPGTGKTLVATLIGKKHDMDVYRIDLSMITSKYIGETEKNLAQIFDLAENRNWILFFDEADALFGKRTATNTSNDRHANQEVAYLLQRIEDFPGTVILATNLRSNIDEAFSRRFQSIVYFPMPTQEMRMELWRKMIPEKWINGNADELLKVSSSEELSGGAIANVIRSCALQLVNSKEEKLTISVLREAFQKEKMKQ